jgi:hypothetical protein
MVIRYGHLGAILTTLVYKDRMTAERWVEELNPDGSVGSKVLDSFLIDEPCLVNETTKDSPKGFTYDVPLQNTLMSVYCSPDCGVKAGDILTILVMGDDGNIQKTIEAEATRPCFMPDHAEIRLYEVKVNRE